MDFEKAKQHFFVGLNLFEKGQYQDAEQQFLASLEIIPDRVSTLTNLSATYIKLRKFSEAREYSEQAILIEKSNSEAYFNLGVIQKEQSFFNEALKYYETAIQYNPNYPEVFKEIGDIFYELKKFDQALDYYLRADGIEYLLGSILQTRMHLCLWDDFNANVECLTKKILAGGKVSLVFQLLSLVDFSELHYKASQILINNFYPENFSLGSFSKQQISKKIRIGYFSADFYAHATSYLIAELFELHDKTKFELIGFDFGPKKDEMSRRIEQSFDCFFDVHLFSDEEIAKLSRKLNIDIAIDLNGLTANGRPGIFSYRAAPIQVNYLVFPATMGADYIDYIIADRTLIPEENQAWYSEKIIYLPGSYQVNDRKRVISNREFSRFELGLPERGFVFCCFNNNYKITPQIFDIWMRILDGVEGSVLWLLKDNDTAAANLRKEAAKRGIDSQRLFFAGRMDSADHLARHRQADLFLDTLPYNAHTTASDALWAGLPVLTCPGESFASRVAASLLNAIELPELITNTLEEYEALAIELALNPSKLNTIKEKLECNRLTTALFDTPLFVKNIEAAFKQIYERYQADMPPNYIYI